MDEQDFIPDAYILEVSSPGLGRQLKKDKDFKRSIDEEVDAVSYTHLKMVITDMKYQTIVKKTENVSIISSTGLLRIISG